jgi:hypothetical protein
MNVVDGGQFHLNEKLCVLLHEDVSSRVLEVLAFLHTFCEHVKRQFNQVPLRYQFIINPFFPRQTRYLAAKTFLYDPVEVVSLFLH